jgi:hypothetical protein
VNYLILVIAARSHADNVALPDNFHFKAAIKTWKEKIINREVLMDRGCEGIVLYF